MPLTMAHALEPVTFASLAGWAADDHGAAFRSFRRSCSEIIAEGAAFARPVAHAGKREHWVEICDRSSSASDPREFFETHFLPFRVIDEQRPAGLFTGYFEPEVDGSRTPDNTYTVPIYGKPEDLVAFDARQQKKIGLSYGRLMGGKPKAYLTRREIEEGALAGQGLEIFWLKNWADAFFIHVQGSGRVRLQDGSVARLAFAAKSGRPYTGIGGLLVEKGIITREDMSMQSLRRWMDSEPQAARELMWQNESFIFFREIELQDPNLGALGAQGVQLTPLRSIAVDRSLWVFGTPVWLDTKSPSGEGAALEDFRKLLVAQDTGSAIKGAARGDVFWGFGDEAGMPAGHMKSPGTMTVLLPIKVANDLGLVP
jgi:membrane-bound lytic murein transglycosylase A